jgi:hypothetical protein
LGFFLIAAEDPLSTVGSLNDHLHIDELAVLFELTDKFHDQMFAIFAVGRRLEGGLADDLIFHLHFFTIMLLRSFFTVGLKIENRFFFLVISIGPGHLGVHSGGILGGRVSRLSSDEVGCLEPGWAQLALA